MYTTNTDDRIILDSSYSRFLVEKEAISVNLQEQGIDKETIEYIEEMLEKVFLMDR